MKISDSEGRLAKESPVGTPTVVEINDLHFTWTRYWLPLEFEIQAGWGKAIFLPNPEGEYERYCNPLASTLDDLSEHRLLVLCGDPASGKTTAINDHFDEKSYDILVVRFRDVLSAEDFKERCFGHEKWKSLAEGRRSLRLVIESLDEGKTQFPNIFDRILSEIEKLDERAKKRLKLVLTCRSFDWELVRGREPELRRALGLQNQKRDANAERDRQSQRRGEKKDFAVWKLCPLRQADVELAAKSALSSGTEDLIESIFARGMQGFAAWPHTLKMVLREFAAGTFATKTRRQLYEDYSLELCRYYRASDLKQDDWSATLESRFLITRQLAALLLCSGKKYISLNRGPFGDSEVGIGQITAGGLSSFGKYSFSEDDVRLALRTANFSEFGAQRFGFNQAAHQECLAAGYLGAFSAAQLRSLFFRSDFQGKYIVPALQHTASWIAEHHEEFRTDVMECNPTILLRSDVTELPNECKPVLIEKMMALAQAEEFVSSGRFFFEGLRHEGVADQFRSFLAKPDLSDAARDLLFDMLRQVAPSEMKEELVSRCKGDWRGHRNYLLASIALIAIATKSGAGALIDLLNDEEFLVGDSDLNVRGRLLQKLVPARIPAREAFQWIGPNGDFERGPSYHMFLETYLPAAMTEADLPIALAYFSGLKKWPMVSSPKAALAEKIVLMALDYLENQTIASLLTAEWIKKHDNDDYFHRFTESRDIREHLSTRESLRRSFATLLITTRDEFDNDSYSPFHMVWSTVLISADRLWVLRQIGESIGPMQKRWAMMFAANFHPSVHSMDFFEENHEEIFSVYERVPALNEAIAYLFAPVELDSERARDERKRHLQLEELKKKGRRACRQKPWKKVVQKYLSEVPIKPGYWAGLAETLRYDSSWQSGRPENNDDERLIGWRSLDLEQQAIALEGARQFLLREKPSEEVSPTTLTNFAEAAGPAVELLLDELPTRLDLAKAVEEKWVPSVLWHGFMNRGEDKRRVADAFYRRWPEVVLRAARLDVEAAAGKDEGLVLLRLHGFENCFDDRFYAVVETFLHGEVRARTVSDIGEWLAEYQPKYFIRLLNEVTSADTPFSETVRFAVLAVGIKQLPKETWNYFEKYVFADDMGKQVIWASASIDLVRRSRGFEGIEDSELGRLYERVASLYPPEETPPRKSGFQESHSLNRVAEFRGLIAQELTSRATPESVNELLRLRRQLPNLADLFLWNIYQATENLRMKEWEPVAIESLAKVILSPDTYQLGETSESLLDVVIKSLNRLQKRVSGSSNPRVLEFWRKGVSGPASNRENRGPYYEEDISWRIAAWLQDDLQTWSSFLVGREVQPRWDQRTDITVDAFPQPRNEKKNSHPKVVIEVKGAWHDKVSTAAVSQLIDTYLAHQFGAVGLYVVCWFGDEFEDEGSRRNHLEARSIEEARAEVDCIVKTALEERPNYLIKGIVLDFSLGKNHRVSNDGWDGKL